MTNEPDSRKILREEDLKAAMERKPRPPPTCSRCDKNPAEEEHTCPYREEIGGDYETTCDCCDDCRHECLWDI
mgnify:CR=1 FL=1